MTKSNSRDRDSNGVCSVYENAQDVQLGKNNIGENFLTSKCRMGNP